MSPTNTEQLITPSIQSSAPAADAEGSESGGPAATEESMGPTDTQASAPSCRKLQNHSIYFKIDGRGTNTSISVYAIKTTSGPLPKGNKDGSAQRCIGTLISHFNKRQRDFKSEVSLQPSQESDKPLTGRSTHADHLAQTMATMQEMMDVYNGAKKDGESEISFTPEKLRPNTLSQRRFSSIGSNNLISWVRKASQDPPAQTASTSSAVVTDTPE